MESPRISLASASCGSEGSSASLLVPYRVTVSDDGTCPFRTLLRERHLRVDRIKEIDWDEDYMIVRHDSGKARVLLDPAFKPFLVRLLELNPMIKVPDDLRSSLDDGNARLRSEGPSA